MNSQNSYLPARSKWGCWLALAVWVMGCSWLAASAEAQSPSAPSLEIQLTGSQQLTLNLSGAAGERYQIESSSNLADWLALLTTNSVTSNVQVTINEPAGSESEFYRAVDLGPVGGASGAVFTLIWPGSSEPAIPAPRDLTPGGSVVFVVQNESGKVVTNQVVNLSSDAGQASVDFSLTKGNYTVVADAFPQPDGVGVPYEEARFSFTVTGGAPVAQTFTLGDNTVINILLTPLNPTVAVAGTLQLNATAFDASNEVVFVAAQTGALTWSSVDTTVATVDYTGKLTGVAPGGSTEIAVAVTANPAITTNIQITVSNEIVGLTLTPAEVAVGVGKETNLTLTATNASGDKVPLATSVVAWTSSSVANAIVDGLGGNGLLIGVAPGLATITLTIKNVTGVPSPIAIANVSIGGPGSGADGVAPPTNGYIITDLGTLPPNISSLPTTINDYGHIAGITWDSYAPTNDTTAPWAFIWKTSLNDQMTELVDLGGGQAEATSINDSDEVVGWSIKPVTDSSPKQYMRAVMWRGTKANDLTGDITDLSLGNPPNISDAFRINNEGQVIGTAGYLSTTNVPWANEFFLDLEQTNVTYLWLPLPWPTAEAINDSGELTGALAVLNTVTYQLSYANAFLGQVGQITSNAVMNLGNLPGYQSGIAVSLNNLNQAAGVCSQTPSAVPEFIQPRAVVWQNGAANLGGTGQATDLGTNGYYSHAFCINDVGTVVGDSWPGGGGEYTDSRAVLWQGTNIYDLNAYIPTNSGWVLDVASGINNKGQIIGQGTRTNEPGYRSFLLTPNN